MEQCRLESWRQDYWHWPFYKKDVLEEKSLTRDEGDYCGEWMIAAYSIGKLFLRFGREVMQGSPVPMDSRRCG